MKSFKRILVLTSSVVSILIFWLAPGINKAHNTVYTRVYENTYKPVLADTTHVKTKYRRKENRAMGTPVPKAYLKESIRSTEKIMNLKATMFSRSIQFMPEVATAKRDSIQEVFMQFADTTRQQQ